MKYRLRILLGLAALLGGGSLDAQTQVLIVTGASGEPQYSASFHTAASSLVDALVAKHGFTHDDITYLAEDPSLDTKRIDGKSSKQELTQAITRAATRGGDRVLLILIGHGSHAGGDSRFNLPGPDLTAAEFAAMLEPLKAKQVAVVNAASASGDFMSVLSSRNRIVVTATKSSYERNETLFPKYFVAAFATTGADTDKDERVSLLEAFTYAKREVARAYESDSRLLTEHAMLNDEGVARRFIIGARTATVATGNDSNRALVTRKEQLEAQVDSLRRRKDTMTAEAYQSELERLLVDLARVNQSLRAGKSQ